MIHVFTSMHFPRGRITASDLPPVVLNNEQANVDTQTRTQARPPDSGSRIQTLAELEREHLIRVLELTGGNRKRAAELLGINRRTLYRMAERFGIEL